LRNHVFFSYSFTVLYSMKAEIAKNFFDILTEARNLLCQKKNLYIKVEDARIESFPDNFSIGGQWTAPIRVPATIKLTIDHGYVPYAKNQTRKAAEYLIPGSDLEDGSEVDKVANIKPYWKERTKAVMRLAFILWDGHKFVNTGARRTDFCPRVRKVDTGYCF